MDSPREAFHLARQEAASGAYEKALELMQAAFRPDIDFALLTRAAKWAKDQDWPGLRPVKAAFLGGGTLEHLVDYAAFWSLLNGLKLEPFIAAYDTWRMEILNPAGSLYAFRPEVVWFFTHWRDFHVHSQPEADARQADEVCAGLLKEVQGYWTAVHNFCPGAQVVQNNLDMVPESAFGNFETMLPAGRVNLIRAFNLRLPPAAAETGVLVFDLERLAAGFGLKNWHSHPYWFHSKHPFSPDLAGAAAFSMAKFLGALKGSAKKVIVLDLDNTLWGGVIGDDGLSGIKLGQGADGEAYAAFQSYLKDLSQRGLVLAVASKNEEAAAKSPFLEHPEMRLHLEDIAVFKANWRNKADNIREIANLLNLGLDAFVFLDDNPAERALVRMELPQVAVPELPADPAEYIVALNDMAYFETVSFSLEDQNRGRMYRENAGRAEALSNVTDLAAYLKSLDMRAASGPADAYHLPRMAQLVNKSNQFHPTTTRYTEAELRALAADKACLLRWFSLQDRFGDYGIIAVLILKREAEDCLIDTWAMSCRVLERGMEEFILRELASLSWAEGAKSLVGRYIPSKKNALVAELYKKLGFSELAAKGGEGQGWSLRLPADRRQRPLYIKTADQEEQA